MSIFSLSWMCVAFLFCNLLIAVFRARWCANAFCWSFFLVKVWKREMWRSEANKVCLAYKERTACFSSLTELLVCILFDVVELIGVHVDLKIIEWITESKSIVKKIKDLCMLCGFTQALLLQHVLLPPGSFSREPTFFSQLDLCMSHLKLLFLQVRCNFAVFTFPLVCWSCRTTLLRLLVFTRLCQGNETEKNLSTMLALLLKQKVINTVNLSTAQLHFCV